MVKAKRARLLITLGAGVLLLLGTLIAVYFARGYRPSMGGTTPIEGTGLLAASSYPEQSSVYIDDKLTTTTNDTINLLPGTYRVKISNEGFIPWVKDLLVEKELVTLTNARLFPAVPSLTALTTLGAKEPTPSPDGQKIAYLVSTADNGDSNGIYVLLTGANPLGLERKATQVVRTTAQINLASVVLTWSPDSKQILVLLPSQDQKTVRASYLLDADRLNQLSLANDVTVRLPFIYSQWEQELTRRDRDLIKNFPEFMVNLASSSATNIYFSPNGEKMLYTATKTLVIPDGLKPKLASINPALQTRTIEPGQVYVYDSKEDTNYIIGTATIAGDNRQQPMLTKRLLADTSQTSTPAGQQPQTLSTFLQDNLTPLQTAQAFMAYYHGIYTNSPVWYPTSRHLIWFTDDKITIREYDNTNQAVVYSGPLHNHFASPSPDGHRLYFLTNLNQTDLPENIYILDLK